ncbi:MAG: magnesium-protoporphyrin IX monomethyl ester (oxidative) cyclase [Cyanobacteria bacterium SID2]|nr:magnesium-protoporphyrin IX monomethyl ester (oxidative) cyclase [Cyanobacteria bacterium SID2]
MTSTVTKPTIEELKPGVKAPAKETLLTPRFYITDFDAVANMDLSLQEEEIETMLNEMRADYNRDHFVRDEEFEQSWDHIDEETRAHFIDFLERSCTSEFSGFLLFKELSRKLKDRNPPLAEMFHLMARDEARHAGFLNKAMGDFNITLDLGYLTKNRSYTFFKPEWIIYAVYLSEKIGYWRYITVFHHLEKHPEHRYYPLFKKFDSWCQDENRHGDIFKALLRSQEGMWKTLKGRLWSRFFLLSVFVTHTLTVLERGDFYRSLGMDPVEFDKEVIRQTNNTSARTFPEILNVEHPEFFKRLHRCAERNAKMAEIDKSKGPKWLKSLRKLPLAAGTFSDFVRLYLIKPIDAEAMRSQVC